jgi:hypothetical protein
MCLTNDINESATASTATCDNNPANNAALRAKYDAHYHSRSISVIDYWPFQL